MHLALLVFLLTPNGTVRDTVTGLEWQQKDGGDMSWGSAGAYCSALKLAGQQDWRLPSARELFSLMDQSKRPPAIDTNIFGASEAEYWWSRDTIQGDSSRVFVVNAGGGVGPHPQEEARASGGEHRFHVRCVRGKGPDEYRGLLWQPGLSSEMMTYEDAQEYIRKLDVGGFRDWRLPTIKELQAIYGTKDAPAFEVWSSNQMAGRGQMIWTMDFTRGIASRRETRQSLRVKAVRGSVIPLD